MIDVGMQRSSLGHGGQIVDPERCIRDMCNQPVCEQSDALCFDCWTYLRGDE